MTTDVQTAPAVRATEDPRPVVGVPPGPRMPRALQTALWAARPIWFMQMARRRYGDVFTVRPYAFGDVVVLANPEHIKEVFTGDRDVFAAGSANAAMAPVLGSHSLLTLDGERHLRQRKLMLPPFHGEAVGRYRERIERITEAELAGWPTGAPFPIRPRMQSITLEVILRAVIGVSDPRRLARLRELLPMLLDFSVLDMWAIWLFPRLLNTRLVRRVPAVRVRPEVDRLLFEEIDAHRADPAGHDDILALLISARDVDGEPLSNDNLLDQIITLLLDGHETTTTGLAWALERLTPHRGPGAPPRHRAPKTPAGGGRGTAPPRATAGHSQSGRRGRSPGEPRGAPSQRCGSGPGSVSPPLAPANDLHGRGGCARRGG